VSRAFRWPDSRSARIAVLCDPVGHKNPEVLFRHTRLGQNRRDRCGCSRLVRRCRNIVGPIEFSQRAFTIDPDPATPPCRQRRAR